MKNLDLITGKATNLLVSFKGSSFLVHRDIYADLNKLFNGALQNGIELAFTSTYRSYEDQRIIWNNKVLGLRPVLDSNSKPVDINTKTKEELLFLILRWSALPGASRHHWGTDFDFYDHKTLPPNYKVQLVPSEYEEHGLFYNANCWLLENMATYGFFNPYHLDTGGIHPEPWHLSYRPLSEKLLDNFSYSLFLKHLKVSDFLLRDEIKLHSAEIFRRFIQV